jgi:hypothetical protein
MYTKEKKEINEWIKVWLVGGLVRDGEFNIGTDIHSRWWPGHIWQCQRWKTAWRQLVIWWKGYWRIITLYIAQESIMLIETDKIILVVYHKQIQTDTVIPN